MDFKLSFPFLNNRAIITIDQFLTNPTGKGSSMMARRKEIKQDLDNRYYKLLKEHKGQFTYAVYLDGNDYYFYFKIPSETYEKLNYDVVLRFQPDDKRALNFSTINDYSMDFFSNSPHMTFTYTYVLKHNNILVPFLECKCSKEALRKPPKVTNPVEMFGFEKTCYYACKYINERKLYDKKTIERYATGFNYNLKKQLLDSIAHQESKLLEYNNLKKQAADKKRKEREKNRKKQQTTTPKRRANTTHAKQSSAVNRNKKTSMKDNHFKSVFKK